MPSVPEQLPEEPTGGPCVPPPRRPTKALPAPGPEVFTINDEPEEALPVAAKEHIWVGAFDEEGQFLEFDELKEDEEVIKLMEHTIKAKKLFLVSPAYPLSPCPRSSELTSLIVSFLQSLSKQMKAKNNFLRKIIPLARSARTLAREKEARAESHTELRSLREENRAMREQILELTGSARGESSVRPLVPHPSSLLEA